MGRAGLQTSFVPRQGGGGGERAPGNEGRLHTSFSNVQDFLLCNFTCLPPGVCLVSGYLCDFNHPPPPPPLLLDPAIQNLRAAKNDRILWR